MCAWCGSRTGLNIQKVAFIKRHFLSGEISTISIGLPICPHCQVYNERRLAKHKQYQKWGWIIPTIIGAILGFILSLPRIDIFLIVIVALGFLLFGLYIKFLITKFLIAIGVYDRWLDRASGSAPNGYAELTKNASTFPNPGWLVEDDRNNWKMDFYLKQFHDEFSTLNPELALKKKTDMSSLPPASLLPVKKIPSTHKDWVTCSYCGAKQYHSKTSCDNCKSKFEN